MRSEEALSFLHTHTNLSFSNCRLTPWRRGIMYLLKSLVLGFLTSASLTIASPIASPLPQLNITDYFGSGCPTGGGLTSTLGAFNSTTGTFPLLFTLSNFTPQIGEFGNSGLRMCDITATLTVSAGYKAIVNAHGTQARSTGELGLDKDTTLSLRGTYQFVERFEVQSIGMLSAPGPISGTFAKLITPVDGDKGIVGPCTGSGELGIEFQARTVREDGAGKGNGVVVSDTRWGLETEVEVVKC
ncbi:hypothetical protein BCR34DRAFT_667576 [Clohesyomyces aquaticus]|uniref:Uncharacterized protein n=1 Tax=Clohesyomyces aquaticus TaxID=1231657 RepID=A0A1Y1YXS8_9PLEO|nr:hypothetical protein BCR34DRAFT_667576 [Clohesyomyces aquaticus]